MCDYANANICTISNQICPYMFFCSKINNWKANSAMPTNCKVKMAKEAPKGYYKVREERKGYLYVDINDMTVKILNPFDEVPTYVKISKSKSGQYIIKK